MSSSLKQQVIQDLKLAGLAQRTQLAYVQAMRQFVAATWLAPDQATQQQVAAYLQQLVTQRYSRGSFTRTRSALQFLFQNTLGHHEWDLFKKDAACPSANACPARPPKRNFAACWPPLATPSTAPAWN